VSLPDPRHEITIAVERGGALCGMGRSKSYVEARRYIETEGREGLPAIAFGRTLRCPTARLLALLGIDPAPNGASNGREHDEDPASATDAANPGPVSSIDRAKINAVRS
jgi:hypothetical protein